MKDLSILVVDDDPVMRRLLQERLNRADYTNVLVAEDGHQATKQLKQHRFDVVLTDLVMPGGISGIEVLEIAKELDATTEVLLITAHSSVDTAVAAMKKGAADYLEKPINFDELLIRIEKISNLKNILRSAQEIDHARSITEREASATIQDLEMNVVKLRELLDKVELILRDYGVAEDQRIDDALQALSES
ncbi:response regulator [Desulfosediminicola flagellatus]|uniref:response regulator n=1 Tax=Desulfosediminicola flagellatus TaxID=2569541 RepID=UPI0010AD8F83|nr:response regulator [Desulfosediminicola flagellatus]